MRGEHATGYSWFEVDLGSSPHARGTLGAGAGARLVGGIIPACAGNTEAVEENVGPRGDHPRMRGEHLSAGA